MTEWLTARGCVCLAVFSPDPDLLRVQLQTISAQTVTDWICLVGIDGNDEETRSLVEALTADDARFVIHEFESNVGFYRNFERLLRLVPVESRWVALADQDDDWFPTKLATLLPLLSHASLAMGQARVVNHADGRVRSTTMRRNTGLMGMMIDNQVTGSLSVLRRGLLDHALPFPPATDAAFHDHWLAICALVEDGVAISPDPVQDYIQHGANIIGEEKQASVFSRLSRLRSASTGVQPSQVSYLATQRWGWRVGMAETVLRHNPSLRDDDRRILAAVAKDRLRPQLAMMVAGAVVRHDAPALRAASAVVGAVYGSHRRRAFAKSAP